MEVLEQESWVRSDSCDLTIRRRKRGRGFSYFDVQGKKIQDHSQLKRIRDLAIPPMWSEVEICALPQGHVQATGRDGKGRKQYIYHPEWQRQRQREKFERLREFGELLPEVRRICYRDLSASPTSRRWVLSLMLLVLDETGIRIGNRDYQRRNETVGLTTLRRKHFHLEEAAAVFSFRGKHGKDRTVELDDEELSQHIRTAAEMQGYELFRYQNEAGQWEVVDSEDVNAFIHRHMGEAFSAKDFRTWVAGRLAIEYYPEALRRHREHPRRKFTNVLLDLVCHDLGNTRAVCRDYYLHPALLEKIRRQDLPVVASNETEPPWCLSESEKVLVEVME